MPAKPRKSYTYKYQKHVPSSFCYYIKCFDDTIYEQDPVAFVAESEKDDVVRISVDSLVQNIKDIYHQFKFPKRMIFTEDNKDRYNYATRCHICKINCGIIKKLRITFTCQEGLEMQLPLYASYANTS